MAIDGSFLKANASQDSMYASKRLQRQLERLEAKIAAYLEQLDAADQQEAAKDQDLALEDPELAAKLECLQQVEMPISAFQLQARAKNHWRRSVDVVLPPCISK